MLKKAIFSLLALILCFSLCVITVNASSETTASVPVLLTVDNNYRVVSVTVPAFLPVEIHNGVVMTAGDAKIINNSEYASVRINKVTVKSGEFKISDYGNFSGNKSIALKINGIETKGEGDLGITSKSFPNISPKGNLPLKYYAKVSADASQMTGTNAAYIIFTISAV